MTVKVLVLGASGALGRPLVRRLLDAGMEVRAACRHPQALDDLAARGADVVAADLTDRASLESACAGVQRLVMAAHAFLGRGRWRSDAVDDAGVRTLIEVAHAARVRQFVYCSAFGAHLSHPVDFFATKARLEAVVRGSGLPATVLRPTAFMEQHVHQFNGAAVLASGKARLIGPSTKPRNFVAAADVAAVAERVLMDDQHIGGTVEIGGHDHLSNAQVAELYAREAGLTLRVSRLPTALARMMAVAIRPVHPGVARVLALQSLPDDAFSERFDGASELEQRFGLQLQRVPDYVRERVVEWRAGRGATPQGPTQDRRGS